MRRVGRARTDGERGSVAPLYLGALAVLIALLGLSVDLSGAWLAHTACVNDLAAARDQVNSAQTALIVKNADDPGRETAVQVARALRENGFGGEIEVWCYEAPKAEMPAGKRESRRLLAWTAQATRSYSGPFSTGLGIGPVAVAASTTSSAVPYSGGSTWRPNGGSAPVGNGLYTFAAGSSEPRYRAIAGLESPLWPAPLREAVGERLDEIASNETKGGSEA